MSTPAQRVIARYIKKASFASHRQESIFTANAQKTVVAYHGSTALFPFEHFDAGRIGSGNVSTNKHFGGFFFTSDRDNASYYAEDFVAKVQISNVNENPLDTSHPPTVLKQAQQDKSIYIIENIVDGHLPADITVVPSEMLNHVKIIDWEFVGDEETLFDSLDELFADEDGESDKQQIEDMLDMMGIDIDYLLKIPVFNKYYTKA